MSLLDKFATGLGSIFRGSGDLGSLRDRTFSEQFRKLREVEQEGRRESILARKEGVGIQERTNVTFGFEEDLEPLSREERDFRATGRLPDRPDEIDTGLLL